MTKNTISVQVTSAVSISDSQETKIINAVAKKFGTKSVEIEKIVDASVIGGIKIIVDSVEYDATVSSLLQKINYQMKNKISQ